jgi:hypothetical protein
LTGFVVVVVVKCMPSSFQQVALSGRNCGVIKRSAAALVHGTTVEWNMFFWNQVHVVVLDQSSSNISVPVL